MTHFKHYDNKHQAPTIHRNPIRSDAAVAIRKKNKLGVTNVAVSEEFKGKRIGLMVAGNSGLPGGSVGKYVGRPTWRT